MLQPYNAHTDVEVEQRHARVRLIAGKYQGELIFPALASGKRSLAGANEWLTEQGLKKQIDEWTPEEKSAKEKEREGRAHFP